MEKLLQSIAAELSHCTVSLVRDFGNFVEVADQNGSRYVADVTKRGQLRKNSVRQTW